VFADLDAEKKERKAKQEQHVSNLANPNLIGKK